MFEEIKRDNAIFQSEALLQDEIAYSVMFSILNSAEKYPEIRCFSDSKNCAIINSDPNHAIIVWTADDFQDYGTLYDFIKKEFYANKPFAIWAKNVFYDYLTEHKIISELEGQKAEDGRENCKH